jgi:hypothetical protein
MTRMPKRKSPALHEVPTRAARAAQPLALLGVVAGSEGTVPLVDWDGNARGPVRARITVPLSPEELLAAVAARQGAMLLFDRGDPLRPVIVGLVQPTSDTPLLDAVLGAPAASAARDARVDGRRVVVEARDEIELRCGESSIVLRRNGRVSIRGVQLETRARGLQRIKGGKVEIN